MITHKIFYGLLKKFDIFKDVIQNKEYVLNFDELTSLLFVKKMTLQETLDRSKDDDEVLMIYFKNIIRNNKE